MGVFNEFATAAFRYGHSQVDNTMLRLDGDWNILSNAGNLDLRDAYFNPGRVLTETGMLFLNIPFQLCNLIGFWDDKSTTDIECRYQTVNTCASSF